MWSLREYSSDHCFFKLIFQSSFQSLHKAKSAEFGFTLRGSAKWAKNQSAKLTNHRHTSSRIVRHVIYERWFSFFQPAREWRTDRRGRKVRCNLPDGRRDSPYDRSMKHTHTHTRRAWVRYATIAPFSDFVANKTVDWFAERSTVCVSLIDSFLRHFLYPPFGGYF